MQCHVESDDCALLSPCSALIDWAQLTGPSVRVCVVCELGPLPPNESYTFNLYPTTPFTSFYNLCLLAFLFFLFIFVVVYFSFIFSVIFWHAADKIVAFVIMCLCVFIPQINYVPTTNTVDELSPTTFSLSLSLPVHN